MAAAESSGAGEPREEGAGEERGNSTSKYSGEEAIVCLVFKYILNWS